MNVRALALGALIGFVVAFAPSCSPPKCGPTNCADGCCDSKGACVKSPNNTNNTTCGLVGNACTDCSLTSLTCNSGACGTTGGGTDAGPCDGCLLPSGDCVRLSRTSRINCGRNQESCASCATGAECTNGACIVPVSAKKVGEPCATDVECQGSGPGALGTLAICKQMTTSGNGAYAGGYCTLRCGTASGQCPVATTCVTLPRAYGEEFICWDNCTPTDRCRTPGYACYPLTGGGGACWISPLPPLDAGVPADKVGNACTTTAQCTNPPETGGTCLSREVNYDWAALGGYCSKTACLSNAECSPDGGALCIGFTGDNPNLCVQKCADSSDGGQSTCRNGFRCGPYTSPLPDGGRLTSTDGFCIPPRAPIPSTIGDQCNVDVDCKVPAGAIADCFPPTIPDGGPSSFTGGYCTRAGCSSSADCSTDGGGQCLFFSDDTSTCFRSCPSSDAGQSTCRADYACNSYGLGDGGRSIDGICTAACTTAPGARACPTGSTCNAASGYCE